MQKSSEHCMQQWREMIKSWCLENEIKLKTTGIIFLPSGSQGLKYS